MWRSRTPVTFARRRKHDAASYEQTYNVEGNERHGDSKAESPNGPLMHS
jgi:hypothetical protein